MSNRHFVAVASGIISAMPILLGLDPSFNALFWILLLTPILTSSELKIAVLCILIQLVYPCISLTEYYFASNNKFLLNIEAIQTQPQLMPINTELLNKLTRDDQQFLSGWDALQTNDWTRAESIFRDLSSKPYEKSLVMNNLGVALQHQGQTEKALDAFIKAARMDSMAFEPVVNQAVIYFANLEYEIAEQKLAEARQMKAAVYDNVFSSMSSVMHQIVVAMPIRDTPERADALSKYYAERYAGPIIQSGGSNGATNIIWAFWPVLGAIAVAVLGNRLTSFNKWHQCNRCGEVFQIVDTSDSNICSNCYQLFILKDDARAEKKKKKMKEVSKYNYQNMLIYMLLGFFAPGCNKLFEGSTNNGFVTFVFIAIFLGMILKSPVNVAFPGEIISDPSSVLRFIGALFISVIYLQSWCNLFFYRSLKE
jgi:tetratricopeptide (TPR) repeat protein